MNEHELKKEKINTDETNKESEIQEKKNDNSTDIKQGNESIKEDLQKTSIKLIIHKVLP